MSDDYQKSIFNVSENDMFNICELLSINKGSVLDGVDKVSEWYEKQPHLPINVLDKRHVTRVLMWTKNSVEKTKKIIDNYYTSRTLFPELYNNRDLNDQTLLNIIKFCGTVMMPILTNEFYRILIIRFTDFKCNEYDPEQGFKFLLMLADFKTHYDMCAGDIIIWDLTHLTIKNTVKFTPMLFKKMFYIVESSYPLKIKAIHCLNCPSYFLSAIKIIKPILKKKIADRIYFHESLEDLHKHVDPKFLPQEYGNNSKTFSEISESILKAMQSDEWKKWYQESECLKSDEAKRIQKLDDRLEELLGIEGSFRKLDID